MNVPRDQKHLPNSPCPICGGHALLQKGKGIRCAGFTNGEYAYCTREQHAGNLPLDDKCSPPAYRHWLGAGDCRCGTNHGNAPKEPPRPAEKPRVTSKKAWEIRYPDGQLFGTHTRLDYDNGGKSYVWPKGTASGQAPLYRSEHIAKLPVSKPVILAEGEKATDALVERRFVAAGIVSGASTLPTDEALAVLKGRTVFLWPDMDTSTTNPPYEGQRLMNRIALKLNDLHCDVRLLLWEDAPPKGDAVDYFQQHDEKIFRAWLSTAPRYPRDGISLNGVHPEPSPEPEERQRPKPVIVAADVLQRMEIAPLVWAVNGILPAGFAFLAGKPKAKKSWLVLTLAAAMATGGKALGSIEVEAGDVLYIALEDSARRLKERLTIVMGGEAFPKRLHYSTKWARSDKGGVEDIEEWLIAHPEARMVAIDTLAKIRPQGGRGNRYDEDYGAVEHLQELAGRYNVLILMVHHLRKGESEDPFESISGTYGLTGAADTMWVLQATSQIPNVDAALHIKGRDVEDQELGLKLWEERMTWQIAGDLTEVSRTANQQAIVSAIRDVNGPLSLKQLAEMTGMHYETLSTTVRRMVKAGALARVGIGKYVVSGGDFRCSKCKKAIEPRYDGAGRPMCAECEG